MTYNFGDIVLVTFPFTNQTGNKKRPAVIVSSETYHDERDDVIVVSVTSNSVDLRSGDVLLEHWEEAGLIDPSVVKAVFLTIEKSLVLRKLGRLSNKDAEAVRTSLVKSFG
jgi:mRNA interferase MazF